MRCFFGVYGQAVWTAFASHKLCNSGIERALAEKLQNPRLLQIKFHSLRHWKATMEYHKTKDILRVKQLLGHKRIDSRAHLLRETYHRLGKPEASGEA